MMKCPADGCNYESSERGVKTHFGRVHDELAPWKTYTCEHCGGKFERSNALVRNKTVCCSISCAEKEKFREKNLVEVTCEICGESLSLYPSHVSDTNLCSSECHGKWVETWDSEKFGAYKGGGRDYYYGAEWKERRIEARKRDCWTCTYDGCEKNECENGKALHVHHINPARNYEDPSEAHSLDNLRTLCAEHHGKVEQKQ